MLPPSCSAFSARHLQTPEPPSQPNAPPKETLTSRGLIRTSPPMGRILQFIHLAKYFLSPYCMPGILLSPGHLSDSNTIPGLLKEPRLSPNSNALNTNPYSWRIS